MKLAELRTLVSFIIKEANNILDENSSTASAGGSYETPKAFGKPQPKPYKLPKEFEVDTTFVPSARDTNPKPKAKKKKPLLKEESISIQEFASFIQTVVNETVKLRMEDWDATQQRMITNPHAKPDSKHAIQNPAALTAWMARKGYKSGEKMAPGTDKQVTVPTAAKARKVSPEVVAKRMAAAEAARSESSKRQAERRAAREKRKAEFKLKQQTGTTPKEQ
jgi:hypothetical protein